MPNRAKKMEVHVFQRFFYSDIYFLNDRLDLARVQFQ